MKKSDNHNQFKLASRKTGRFGRRVISGDRDQMSLLQGSPTGIEVSYLKVTPIEEDPYETLCCLKWGAHYGLITESAYEAGKADLLTRL